MKKVHGEKYRRLGLKIAYYRRLRSITQEELAESIDMSPVFISQVEAPNMITAISFDTLFDVAEVLDVPPYKFLQFDDD